MSETSSIEWTDATWNPTRGCSRVSEGCTNCYAMREAHRHDHTGGAYAGLTHVGKRGVDWSGRVILAPEKLTEPLRWRKPRRVFVNSMSDLFHESLPDAAIDQVFAVMALAMQHTFQILTKRPERMRRYMEGRDWSDAANAAIDRYVRRLDGPLHLSGEIVPPLPNVWLGVSVENQATADQRIPLLLQTPSALRWVSYEPALGPVRFTVAQRPKQGGPFLDWIVVGGESGPGARAFELDWARSVIRQCRQAGKPVFVKQLGRIPIFDDGLTTTGYGKKGEWFDLWPEDLRVREFPS